MHARARLLGRNFPVLKTYLMSVQWINSSARGLSPGVRRRPSPPPRPLSPRPGSRRETYTAAPQHDSTERREIVALNRAESLSAALESARADLASSERRVAQLQAQAEAREAALRTEIDARAKAEALLRTRCEIAERELRELRSASARQFERSQRDAAGAVAHAGETVASRGRDALRDLARRWLASSVLAWRRRLLSGGLAGWRRAAELIVARRQLETLRACQTAPPATAPPLAAALGRPAPAPMGSAEERATVTRRRAAARRLLGWAAAAESEDVLRALSLWRTAALAGVLSERLGLVEVRVVQRVCCSMRGARRG